MNLETETEQPVPAPAAPSYSVPWKFIDNWIGVVLLALIQAVIAIITLRDFQKPSLLRAQRLSCSNWLISCRWS